MRSNSPFNKLLSILLFVAACSLFAWAHTTFDLYRWYIAVLSYGLSALLLIIRECVCYSPPRMEIRRRGVEIGALLAVIITASILRMSYIYTVRLGISDMLIGQILWFADTLLKQGFRYLPMWGHNSTGHAYVLAGIWKVFDHDFSSFRIFMGLLGVLSAGVMFWWLKRLFGIREALLGGIILAGSPFHQCLTRSGWNIIYVPLFTMLFFGVLFIMFQSKRKITLAILASFIFVLAMHLYWIFALELPAAVIFIIYCSVTERGFLKQNIRALSVMAVLTAVLMVPYVSYFTHDAGNRTAHMKEMVIKREKGTVTQIFVENLRRCFTVYTTSPYVRNKQTTTPVASKAVLIAGGIGFFLCLSKFRRSRAHAMLVILFLTELAGVCLTSARFWYIFYLLLFWLSFAAIAAAEAWKMLEDYFSSKTWKVSVCLLFLTLIAASAVTDYRYYFEKFIYLDAFSVTVGPSSKDALGAYILDDIKSAIKDFDVYLPKEEREKDFGVAIFVIGEKMRNYSFIQSTKTMAINSIFFPGPPSGKSKGVMVYLPVANFWTDVVIPRLKALYPNMQVINIMPPEPWVPNDKPMLLKLMIPPENLLSRRGLKTEKSETGGWSAQGYFLAEQAGYYSFECGEGCKVEVGGAAADTPVLLAEGVVAIKVQSNGPAESKLRIFLKGAGDHKKEISGNLFNAPPSAEGLIVPCVSRSAVPGGFAFIAQTTYDLGKAGLGQLQGAIIRADGTIYCISGDGAFKELNTAFSPKRNFTLKEKGTYRLAASSSGRVLAYIKGSKTVYSLEDKGPIPVTLEGSKEIEVLDFGKDNSLFVLSKGKILVYEDGKWGKILHEREISSLFHDTPALKPYSMAAGKSGEVAILDAERQELVVFSLDGKVTGRVAVPHLWTESFVRDDPDGNWYIFILPRVGCMTPGDSIYDSSLRPVLNPKYGWEKSLFWASERGDKQSFGNSRSFRFLINGDVSFMRDNAIHYMHRTPITAVGGSEAGKSSPAK